MCIGLSFGKKLRKKELKSPVLLDNVEPHVFLQNILNVLPLTRRKFAFKRKWFPVAAFVQCLALF